MSFGDESVGEMSVGEMSVGDVSGNLQSLAEIFVFFDTNYEAQGDNPALKKVSSEINSF